MHVVRRGESLWTIARRNNMDVRTLMRLNNKSSKDVIRPGERLVLRRDGESRAGGQDAASGVTHRVRSGETLSSIARRYGVSVQGIKAWNGIRGSTIRAGGRLVIYKDLRVPPVSKMLQ